MRIQTKERKPAYFVKAYTESRQGWGSSVGIATRYGLDDPGIEFGEGEVFRALPDRHRGRPSLLYNGNRFSFPGVKRPGSGVNHPPHLTSSRAKFTFTFKGSTYVALQILNLVERRRRD